jgi:hypothetical protein
VKDRYANILLCQAPAEVGKDINRPIIFVCHSLGGIIVKEVRKPQLRICPRAQLTKERLGTALIPGGKFQPRQQKLYQDTYGVIFLGTPHRGSLWASWAKLASNLAKVALQAPSTSILQSLHVDSGELQRIADEFKKMIRDDIKTHSFREERGMSGLYGLDAKESLLYRKHYKFLVLTTCHISRL